MSGEHPAEQASTIPVEARAHQGHEAGIVSRLLAAGLDLVVVVGVLVAGYVGWCVAAFVVDARGFDLPRPSPWLVLGSYVVVAVACLALPWCVDGRSYGQHVMGLRVTTREGDLLRLPRALLRAVVCVLFPVSLAWVVVSRRDAAAHDILLRTTVHYDWRTWT
jgi:uncharacterized RDD family membrane protein YckC